MVVVVGRDGMCRIVLIGTEREVVVDNKTAAILTLLCVQWELDWDGNNCQCH